MKDLFYVFAFIFVSFFKVYSQNLEWINYNTSNSSLPDDDVNSLAIDENGNKWIGTWNGLTVYKEGGVVSVADNIIAILPNYFSLSQNYPNPFNPSTKIGFSVPQTGNVKITVYNAIGQKVATLINYELQTGNHKVNFDASKLTSGIYFYKMESGSFVSTKKMVLVK